MSGKERRVLLAVVGLTPQVVTETLYYLVVKREIKIDEIRLITTIKGRKLAEELLLGEPDGALWRFCRDYNLDRDCIYVAPTEVIRDPEGNPLEDIRSAEDNAAAGDCILRVVADYKKDPTVRLFCSLAGGRKTMSTFAGFAMQLLADPGDELLHVLVRPPALESRRDFFYPPADGDFVGQNPDGSLLRVPADEINIECAQVPFVRLRRWLAKTPLADITNYRDLVSLTQRQLDLSATQLRLKLDVGQRRLTVQWQGGSQSIQLQPRHAAIYHFFMQHAGEEFRSDKFDKHHKYAGRIDELYREHYVRGTARSRAEWRFGDFLAALSRLDKAIRKAPLPPEIAELCLIARSRRGGYVFYKLDVPRDNCEIVPPPPRPSM